MEDPGPGQGADPEEPGEEGEEGDGLVQGDFEAGDEPAAGAVVEAEEGGA